KIRQQNPARVADDDVLDVAISIDKHAYLAANLSGDFRELPGKFLGHNRSGWYAPLVEFFKLADLAGLQPLYIAFDVVNSVLLIKSGFPRSYSTPIGAQPAHQGAGQLHRTAATVISIRTLVVSRADFGLQKQWAWAMIGSFWTRIVAHAKPSCETLPVLSFVGPA